MITETLVSAALRASFAVTADIACYAIRPAAERIQVTGSFRNEEIWRILGLWLVGSLGASYV